MKSYVGHVTRVAITMVCCCLLMSCGSSSGGRSAAPAPAMGVTQPELEVGMEVVKTPSNNNELGTATTTFIPAPLISTPVCSECTDQNAPVSAQQVCDVFNGISDTNHDWSAWQTYLDDYLGWLSENAVDNKGVRVEVKSEPKWASYHKSDTQQSYIRLPSTKNSGKQYRADRGEGTPEDMMLFIRNSAQLKIVNASYIARNQVSYNDAGGHSAKMQSLIMPICIHKIDETHLAILKGTVTSLDKSCGWLINSGLPTYGCNRVDIDCSGAYQASDVVCKASKTDGIWSSWQVPAENSSQSIKIWNAYDIREANLPEPLR